MKKILFLVCLLPFSYLIYKTFLNQLGANPISEIIHFTGLWALNFFLITLAMTPLRTMFNIVQPLKFRRMLGLFASFYLTLHFVAYSGLDLHFNWSEISHDLLKHPFVYVGFSALLLTLPLVVTSTNYAQRRLKKNWKRLHKLAYLIPLLGVVHFWWLVKRDLTQPILYAIVLSGLLGIRLVKHFQQTKIKP